MWPPQARCHLGTGRCSLTRPVAVSDGKLEVWMLPLLGPSQKERKPQVRKRRPRWDEGKKVNPSVSVPVPITVPTTLIASLIIALNVWHSVEKTIINNRTWLESLPIFPCWTFSVFLCLKIPRDVYLDPKTSDLVAFTSCEHPLKPEVPATTTTLSSSDASP